VVSVRGGVNSRSHAFREFWRCFEGVGLGELSDCALKSDLRSWRRVGWREVEWVGLKEVGGRGCRLN
jgi:hypothetical protein